MKKILFKIILSVTIAFSIAGKLYSLDETILYFEQISGIEYVYIFRIIIILIIIEMLIIMIIVFNFYRIPYLYYPILLFFTSMLIINIFFLFLGVENCACFGVGIRTSPLFSIIKCLVLIGSFMWIKKHNIGEIKQEVSK